MQIFALALSLSPWIPLAATGVPGDGNAQDAAVAAPAPARAPESGAPAEDWCGFLPRQAWLAELRAAVARGEVPDPRTRPIPPIPEAGLGASVGGGGGCLATTQIFPYEDSTGLLTTNFSTGALINLMVDAANALMATWGDNYDFVGYWVNSTPHHTIGAAFYAQIENDVTGIGQGIYNERPAIGLGGQNIEGFVMMWNINTNYWQPGTGSNANFTRLALGQEFEHRFAMFLPPLNGGRRLQGDNGSCGRAAHWNWKVDGQGSSMEISEWTGANPANLAQSFVSFNTDIGGVFSYTDLYLMGYVTPSEMDAGNSELRYMDLSNCSQTYPGPISTFSSSDIVASAGPRVPGAASAQQSFRTAWIMIHQPGDPPSQAELQKAVSIHERHQLDWAFGTLGRGVMNDALFDDCNCNGVPDASDITSGSSTDVNGNGIPDECECSVAAYCTAKTNSQGCTPAIDSNGVPSATAPSPFEVVAGQVINNKSGLLFYGFGSLNAPFQGGRLCVVPPVRRTASQSSGGNPPPDDCSGSYSFDFNARIQSGIDPNLTPGTTVFAQYWSRDPASPSGTGLTDALRFSICP